ncbi:MAG: acyl-CoA thioesterase [Gemmatimonadota bacterium]|nr:acyl-CoA thioesterase [Gemmatimonadota bacterium]MDH4349548.1 acyl-CoA thioesterase [Gemmatimonadota bacterium]MDH5195714.1 acyl-CoA thioesterase [Gemmatimonadota bacterium]
MSGHPFAIEEYVRWSDVDHAGIIFYGAYVRFFEIAETEMFRAAGLPYSQFFEQMGLWLPRVHFDCDFRYPARLDDRLRVVTYVSRFGRTSLTLSFDVWHVDAGQLAAAAREVLVCTDRTSLAPIPVPAELRTALGPFVFTETAVRAMAVPAAGMSS